MMSTAEELREARLTDYLDDELDPASREELDALFEGDEALRRSLDDARAARELLRGLPRPAVPRGFLRKVQRRVRRRTAGRGAPGAFPFGMGLSVEVFVVVAVAVMAACWFVMESGRRAHPGRLVDDGPAAVEVPAAGAGDRSGARLEVGPGAVAPRGGAPGGGAPGAAGR